MYHIFIIKDALAIDRFNNLSTFMSKSFVQEEQNQGLKMTTKIKENEAKSYRGGDRSHYFLLATAGNNAVLILHLDFVLMFHSGLD